MSLDDNVVLLCKCLFSKVLRRAFLNKVALVVYMVG